MSEAVHCAVRIRPPLGDGFESPIWTVNKNVISKGAESYTFEQIFDQMSRTEEIFDSVKPLIDGTLKGVNASIMAYGQSSSGKTHTLTGNRFEEGVVQMSLKRIFQKIEESDRTFALRMSICEVYNEKIFDLIGNGEDLSVRESAGGNIRVEGLTEKPLTQLATVEGIVDASIKRRNTGETARNERSSRSHVLFIIHMESRSNSSNRSLFSSLCIVDLAGSENALLSQGSRMLEGKFINKSLLALCRVITQLSEKQSHVGYRESKLTRLLKPSLSGNSRIVIIATIDGASVAETSSTLKFAKCAVKVSVTPKVNVNVEEEGILASYMTQIEELKEQLKDKEEADNKEEEKKKKLDELLRLILVGGEKKKEPIQSKKTRRMTWAPGRAALSNVFSPPTAFFPRRMNEKDKIEEEEEGSNHCHLDTELNASERLSMTGENDEHTKEEIEEKENEIATHISKEKDLLDEPKSSEEQNDTSGRKNDEEWQRKMALLEKELDEKKMDLELLEERLRTEIVNEIQTKIGDKMKGMMEEISQLKRENQMKDQRIECLLRAEQSMLMGPSAEMEDIDRMQEKIEEIEEKLKEKEDQVKERDHYIRMMRKKEDEAKKKIGEVEKKCVDQQQTIGERTSQVNRYRNEMNEMKIKNEKEIELLEINSKMALEKLEKEMKGMEMKIELMEEERNRLDNEMKKLEANREEMRRKCLSLSNELAIEKETRKNNRRSSQTQTDVTSSELEATTHQFETLRREYDDYRLKMEKKEAEGRELAQSNVKYWQDRARKAEKKNNPLSRIENRTTN